MRAASALQWAKIWTDEILAQLSADCPVSLVHADLLPRNIMVSGPTITGVTDWEWSGWYPQYVEYCRMTTVGFDSDGPSWRYIVDSLYPRPYEGDKAFRYMSSSVYITMGHSDTVRVLLHFPSNPIPTTHPDAPPMVIDSIVPKRAPPFDFLYLKGG